MTDRVYYTCPCGAEHDAGAWAAAHWHEEMVHTCKECGRTNVIESGEVVGSEDDGVR